MPRRRKSSPSPTRAPVRSVTASTPPRQALQEQPGIFSRMAATAGGFTVGSALGHVIGDGLSRLFNSGGSKIEHVQPQPVQNQEPCSWEIMQFLQCTEQRADLSLCQDFKEAINECKLKNNIKF